MRINDDLSRPVIVHAARQPWMPSPAAGVNRRMLFRVGDEVARATSIVRYAEGSAFPRHAHGGGEEILVLDGVFEDEHGDYPAGSYFRNPPGTSHVPASRGGCTIFVRLWQFRDGDTAQIVRRPGEGRKAETRPGGIAARILFDDGKEAVCMEAWRADERVEVENGRGLEFLVLAGELWIGGETLQAQSWCRLPAGADLVAEVGPDGASVWMRDAPLMHADVLSMPGA